MKIKSALDFRMVILAGDVHPIDIMSHIPGVCEGMALPYVYVPSRQDLGQSIGTLRSILLMLIKPKADYQYVICNFINL